MGKTISQTLTAYLKDKRLLLLLDNCEHLLEGCARLADMLVRQCPHLTILASSREALGIGGEQAYRVTSLSVPDCEQVHTPLSVTAFEAVQLFLDRARLARPDFQLIDRQAPALVSICQRLDGIPLAIELAAARVRSLCSGRSAADWTSVSVSYKRLAHRAAETADVAIADGLGATTCWMNESGPCFVVSRVSLEAGRSMPLRPSAWAG